VLFLCLIFIPEGRHDCRKHIIYILKSRRDDIIIAFSEFTREPQRGESIIEGEIIIVP